MKYKINENVSPELESFMLKIKSAILRHFPNSFVRVGLSTTFGKSVFIAFTLGKDKSNYSNGIPENDPMALTFHIFFKGNDISNLDNLSLESGQRGARLTVKSNNRYLAFESIKLPFRQTKGDASKLLKAINVFFERAKDIVFSNIDNMDDRHRKLLTNYPEFKIGLKEHFIKKMIRRIVKEEFRNNRK